MEVIHALQGTELAVLISQPDAHHGSALFVRQYTIERGAMSVLPEHLTSQHS